MKSLLLLFVFTTSFAFSQEICDTPNESILNLNTIDKCSVESSENHDKPTAKTREITVRVSANSKRFLKRREQLKNLSKSNNTVLNTTILDSKK